MVHNGFPKASFYQLPKTWFEFSLKSLLNHEGSAFTKGQLLMRRRATFIQATLNRRGRGSRTSLSVFKRRIRHGLWPRHLPRTRRAAWVQVGQADLLSDPPRWCSSAWAIISHVLLLISKPPWYSVQCVARPKNLIWYQIFSESGSGAFFCTKPIPKFWQEMVRYIWEKDTKGLSSGKVSRPGSFETESKYFRDFFRYQFFFETDSETFLVANFFQTDSETFLVADFFETGSETFFGTKYFWDWFWNFFGTKFFLCRFRYHQKKWKIPGNGNSWDRYVKLCTVQAWLPAKVGPPAWCDNKQAGDRVQGGRPLPPKQLLLRPPAHSTCPPALQELFQVESNKAAGEGYGEGHYKRS